MKAASVFLVASVALTAVLHQPSFASQSEPGWRNNDSQQTFERRKKRVKGGSGCDDPGDVAEHPECR